MSAVEMLLLLPLKNDLVRGNECCIMGSCIHLTSLFSSALEQKMYHFKFLFNVQFYTSL